MELELGNATKHNEEQPPEAGDYEPLKSMEDVMKKGMSFFGQISKESEKLSNKNKELQTKVEELETKLRKKVNKVSQLRQEKSEYSTMFVPRSEIDEHIARINELETNQELERMRWEAERQEYEKQKERNEKQEQERLSLFESLKLKNMDIIKHKKMVEELELALAEAEGKKEELIRETESLLEINDQFQDIIQKQKGRIDELEDSIATERANVSKLATQLENKTLTSINYQETITGLTDNVSNLKALLDAKQTQYRKDMICLETQLKNVDERIKDKQQDVNCAKALYEAKLLEAKTGWDLERSKLVQQLEEKERTINNLSDEVSKANNKAKMEILASNRLRETIAQKDSQARELQDKFSDIERRYENKNDIYSTNQRNMMTQIKTLNSILLDGRADSQISPSPSQNQTQSMRMEHLADNTHSLSSRVMSNSIQQGTEGTSRSFSQSTVVPLRPQSVRSRTPLGISINTANTSNNISTNSPRLMASSSSPSRANSSRQAVLSPSNNCSSSPHHSVRLIDSIDESSTGTPRSSSARRSSMLMDVTGSLSFGKMCQADNIFLHFKKLGTGDNYLANLKRCSNFQDVCLQVIGVNVKFNIRNSTVIFVMRQELQMEKVVKILVELRDACADGQIPYDVRLRILGDKEIREFSNKLELAMPITRFDPDEIDWD